MNIRTTKALGIFQSDVICRTALIAAFKDLRANPQLLDYVFASLAQDDLTFNVYGEKEVNRAKEWFLKTDIPVFVVPRIDEGKIPCISIKLVSSAEAETTLGDVHYEPQEEVSEDQSGVDLPLAIFTPTGYNPQTGAITANLSVSVVTGMVVVDATGIGHPVLSVDDTTFSIEPGSWNLSSAQLKAASVAYSTRLESVQYREALQLGVHVSGEPVYLTWLHSIVVFCLLRYKQQFFEARGFERSVFSSTDFDREELAEGQLAFSRYINVTGYVRHFWPKNTDSKAVASILQPVRVIDVDRVPADTNVNDALWIGEQDILGSQS